MKKARLVGTREPYAKMLNQLLNLKDVLKESGYCLNDAIYFGVDSSLREEEWEIYDELEKYLEEFIEILEQIL